MQVVGVALPLISRLCAKANAASSQTANCVAHRKVHLWRCHAAADPHPPVRGFSAGGAPVWRIELENTNSKWINPLMVSLALPPSWGQP